RDPFRRPEIVEKEETPLTELEKFSVAEIKLVGIMTGPTRLRAMVKGPDGKTYFVAEKMRVGTRKGIVREITPETVIIREKIVNVLGEEENIDIELRIDEQTEKTQGG